nr:MAG TPA: hypothetical protein [Caudoviricetes sp.]DAZ23953.1 MAG TPA: hypothetical protein [Caudoviricetes sp.]
MIRGERCCYRGLNYHSGFNFRCGLNDVEQ